MPMESDEPEDDEDRLGQSDPDGMTRDAWLAGVIARNAEKHGLIRETDQFSRDWHLAFDDDFEAAKAEANPSVEGPTAVDVNPFVPGEEMSNAAARQLFRFRFLQRRSADS